MTLFSCKLDHFPNLKLRKEAHKEPQPQKGAHRLPHDVAFHARLII